MYESSSHQLNKLKKCFLFKTKNSSLPATIFIQFIYGFSSMLEGHHEICPSLATCAGQ